MSVASVIEQAFARIRAELEVPGPFPAGVVAEAERAAAGSEWRVDPRRVDLSEVPFLTIDPPGSLDLDQALHVERAGEGFRVRYAIADVGAFVERGSATEAEAWRRGVTYYSPDRRDTLYPEAISQGAASLLPEEDRPSLVFDLALDARGELTGMALRPAVVRSRAQLTYAEALARITGDGESPEEWAATLPLLREVGELRLERERERGGVSLPILEQHVQRRSALRLGYHLVYEDPNPAEEWNAQISLLAGHAAAERMLAAGVGLLRTQPPGRAEDEQRVRLAARALGFEWPASQSYPDFLHAAAPDHPHLPILVWQARRMMRGADYLAFQGESPEHARHSALAMTYSHCTAPLRRLADRYVLDLLATLEAGGTPTAEERATLDRLPPVMEVAQRRASRLERLVVDVAEAWELRDRVGELFPAVALAAHEEWAEVQVAEPPVRARLPRAEGDPAPAPGDTVRVRVEAVSVEEGRLELRLVPPGRPATPARP